MVTILAISEGWNRINPSDSQRLEPFTVTPIINTALKDKIVMTVSSKDLFFNFFIIKSRS